jgi:CBS domain-containing protein
MIRVAGNAKMDDGAPAPWGQEAGTVPRRRANMLASDIMTRRVITTTAHATIEDAALSMLQHRVSGLPVITAEGTIVGVVSEGDLLRRAEIGTQRRRSHWLEFIIGPGRLAGEYVRSHTHCVGDIMTREVISIAPETALEDAVALMERHRVKRLPVLENGRLVGIVSRADLLRAVAKLFDSPALHPVSDALIRRGILAEIETQPWAPRRSIDVVVTKGVVELCGTLTDERERQALRVAAETFPGVTGVVDHLVWVEPMSGMVVEAPSPDDGHGPVPIVPWQPE